MVKLTKKEIEIANATSRSGGAVGAKALVPKLVRDMLRMEPGRTRKKILDYGAGKHATHAGMLRWDEGLHVTAYEMGANFDPERHDADALKRTYDVVYASNVLNTLASRRAITGTITEIRAAVDGVVWAFAVVNYPDEPRKCDITTDEMRRMLERRFRKVERSKISPANRPVWVCWP